MRQTLAILISLLGLAAVLSAADAPHPVTLSECIQIAEEKHPDLASPRAVINEAQAQMKIQRSGFLPRADIGGSYIRQSYNFAGSASMAGSPGFAGAPGTSPHQLSLFTSPESLSSAPYYYGGLTLSQTIYDFGRTRGQVNRSEAELEAARRNFLQVRDTIDLNVREAYYGVLASEELVRVRTESVNNQSKHLEQIQAFFEVGTRPKIDVTRQAVALANAQVDLRQAQENLQVARAALATSMGLPIDQAPEPVNTLRQEEVPETLNQLMDEAQRNRPDVQALQQQIRAAQADILIARSALRPDLELSTFFDYRNLKFPLIYNWSLGVLAAQNLFAGGANHAQVIQAQAEEQQAQANLDSLLQQVRQQVYRSEEHT